MPEVEKISISGTPIDIVSSKVLQKPIGYSENYEVLFSGSANNISQTDEVGKSDGFIYNPGLKYVGVGSNNIVTGAYSACFGSSSEARGARSFAQGCGAKAHGEDSQSEGTYTSATHKSQHVFGECNALDPSVAESTERGTYVEIVGNGASMATRSNARTLDWDGNEVLAGKLTVGTAPTANMDVATKKYVDDADAVINSSLTNLIKRTTVTNTTSATGSYNSGLEGRNVRILNAIPLSTNADQYCIITMTGQDNFYWFTIKNLSTNNPITNTSVSVTVYYIDVN